MRLAEPLRPFIRGTCPRNGRRNNHAGFDADAMRGVIAAAMSRSKREIPHYYLTETIDLRAVSEQTESRGLPESVAF